jgi:hypothetical protein
MLTLEVGYRATALHVARFSASAASAPTAESTLRHRQFSSPGATARPRRSRQLFFGLLGACTVIKREDEDKMLSEGGSS